MSSSALSENIPSNALREKIHRGIFIGALSLLCIGMPTSAFFMSISQLILGLNWLAEDKFTYIWKKFINNKAAVVLCSFFIMHLLGLLYTSDFSYGLEDVKKKVPLFLLPFIFCTSKPLTEKERNIVLGLFMGAVTFTTMFGTFLLTRHAFSDIRNISPFISAIRLALMIVLSVFLLGGYIISHKWSSLSALLTLWMLWLLAFLLIMESLTGAVVIIILFGLLLLYTAFRKIKQKKLLQGSSILVGLVVVIIGVASYFSWFHQRYFPAPDNINFSNLDKASAKGELYNNNITATYTENGHYVYIYIAPSELKTTWNKRATIPFDSLDRKGNKLEYTLIRYLTSMNLRKDSEGVSKLSVNDIKAIERGIPNYNFTARSNMEYRIYEAFWEIENYRHGNISGHSITQRMEFWHAALGIIHQHWIAGVGTGDVRTAFATEYNKMHSPLSSRWRLRSHNQYLEIGVGFGLIGIIWFLFSLFYPPYKMNKFRNYAFMIFFIIILLSMCSEDTLETQAGATFYAFFNSFFLFLLP